MHLNKNVVLLGSDWVGKTTQAKLLQKSCPNATILSPPFPLISKDNQYIFDGINPKTFSIMERISWQVFLLKIDPKKDREVNTEVIWNQEEISRILTENQIDYTTLYRHTWIWEYNEIMQTHYSIIAALHMNQDLLLELPIGSYKDGLNKKIA